jgi:hypothetical protein
MSQYFEVHPDNPQPRLLKQATQILHAGGIAAIPTDSSYALVCHLDDKAAAAPRTLGEKAKVVIDTTAHRITYVGEDF